MVGIDCALTFWPSREAGASPSTEVVYSFFLFIFCFLLFYFLLFYFALLLCLALPSPALFFSDLLCSDLFYVGSDRPSGATLSDEAATGC